MNTTIPMKPGLLCFVISNNHHMLPDQFFWSYLKMRKPNGSLAIKGSSSVKCSSINDGIHQALLYGAEWVFLMDVDQTFPPMTIPRLMDTAKRQGAKIVSVLYHLGRAPYAPVAGWVKEKDGEEIYVNAKGESWRDYYAPLGQGVVEVDWVGSGGLLIHRDVLAAIGWPPFLDEWTPGLSFRKLGHDITFSERARAAGFKLYVDTAVNSGHGKFQYFDQTWAEGFNNSNMLDAMGGVIHRQALEAEYWDTVWQDELIRGYEREKQYADTFKAIVDLVPDNAQVADAGCGGGVLMTKLRDEKKAQCTGLDFSAQAIDIIHRKGFPGRVVDFRNFEVNGDGGKYDVVVATHVLEHMQEDKAFLQKLKTMCKRGGQVIVATPAIPEVQDILEHVRGYSDQEIADLMASVFESSNVTKNARDYVAVGKV
jgi:2-polyprenyl-3-methyl-5-hydroxy-6-metoxy-1,4-benzoquinol methylase